MAICVETFKRKVLLIGKINLAVNFHSILQIDIFKPDVMKASREKLSYSTVHNSYNMKILFGMTNKIGFGWSF